jgi:hypothetical protein
MRAAIVLTSINDCTELLDGYSRNFARYGRQASIILIPDRKTIAYRNIPPPIQVPCFDRQEKFLKDVGFIPDEIPWNSDNRRNIGYLMALAEGAEMIISIDDDNFCPLNEDFIGEHIAALAKHNPLVSTEDGWYNNCNLLKIMGPEIFARGFPYYARRSFKVHTQYSEDGQVVINAGMWTGAPDVDALTWLQRPGQVARCTGSAVLAPDTWCPINSQNTAVRRDAMAAYYFVCMEAPIDRYGDIFQGYFALKCAKHLGFTARFGTPVATHRRNSHNYLADAEKEIFGIRLMEELLPKLLEHKLTGSSFGEAYLSLADFIESQDAQFFKNTARRMRLWATTCQRIG